MRGPGGLIILVSRCARAMDGDNLARDSRIYIYIQFLEQKERRQRETCVLELRTGTIWHVAQEYKYIYFLSRERDMPL